MKKLKKWVGEAVETIVEAMKDLMSPAPVPVPVPAPRRRR